MAALPIDLDRAGRTPLAVQIYGAIRSAIETGRLASGAYNVFTREKTGSGRFPGPWDAEIGSDGSSARRQDAAW